jgi:GDP-4-dehydro-6-deoxy-D-mannose reductase
MRVLITGGGGFLAGHLATYLKTVQSVEIKCLTRAECDLATDERRLIDLLRAFRPDRIFHLAGRTNGSKAELFRDNGQATANLLSAIRSISELRLVLASTTAVYGAGGTASAPLREEQTPDPRGDYAISNYESEQLAQVSAPSQVVIARISNPVGPGMSRELLCGTLARQIVGIERGAKNEVVLRGLTPKRDFLGVNDCVRALAWLAESGIPSQTYNVAAGVSVSIAEVVDLFLKLARVHPIEVVERSVETQRSPVQEQWVSNARLVSLGWRTEETLPQVICALLESERLRP